MRRLFYIFGLLAVVGSVALAVSGEPGLTRTVVASTEMSKVIGGGACEKCYNMCAGDTCKHSDCGSDDEGEFCGVKLTISAYVFECLYYAQGKSCGTWGGGGLTNFCNQKVCRCHGQNDCRAPSSTKTLDGDPYCQDTE
jgi:hypothetical protein